MKCLDCGSRKITWEIDSGYIINEYDEDGEVIDHTVCLDGINSPQCAMCDSTNLGD